MSRYQEKNPFDDDAGANPFADPAVTAHTRGGDYGSSGFNSNPFGQEPSSVAPAARPVSLPPEPAAAATDEIPLGNDNVKKKEKALKAKEAELAKKEEELRKREEAARRSGATVDEKNWPFACFPIAHHDIAKDIPADLQHTTRLAYFTYLGLILGFIWNLVCVTAAWADGQFSGSDGIIVWFMAALYMVLGIPLAWFLWYKRLYNAMRRDRALTFAWFFLMYLVHIAWCIIAAVAPPFFVKGKSLTGLLSFISALDGSFVVGIMYLVGCILWVLETLLSIWVIKNVYLYFRSSGKQQEAQRQAARGVISAAV